ncbi:MAG: helix-turn-helix domain-containing protein [bacterium]
MSDALTDAVRRAIERAPCSVAKLARAAGIPQSTLARIQAGERNATPSVARSLARGLDGWSARCARLGDGIRQALLRGNR